jgi:hypothetical protein
VHRCRGRSSEGELRQRPNEKELERERETNDTSCKTDPNGDSGVETSFHSPCSHCEKGIF